MPDRRLVVGLEELDRTQVALAGGKGAALGELMRIPGVRVPPGFVVTTAAGPELPIEEITARLADGPYAIRSSATAEDSATASFAGQHDSYLNVVGAPAVLERIRACRASLFGERAVAYRRRNGLADGAVRMAVVVQEMVPAEAAGVLFTADPISGHRKVSSIEAVRGLGDGLVSGHVTPQVYEVRDGAATLPAEAILTEVQVLRLAQLGRAIEAHFGGPQDLEWCLVDDDFHIVQSRPITTLFPIPAAADAEPRVYVSVGHAQMMTDAMKPLGLSLFQLTAGRGMSEAGGRLFVDVTRNMASPSGRAGLLATMGKGDPLIGDALKTIAARDFVRSIPDEPPPAVLAPPSGPAPDPAIVDELIARTEASLAALERDIEGKTGVALLDFVMADLVEMKRLVGDPQSLQIIVAAVHASWWLDDKLEAWLGEKHAADTLTQSVDHNVTSEMGLELLAVADVFRRHPSDVVVLERAQRDDFLDDLGGEAREALRAFLARYGMRCAGEIDITRPRWSERPTTLVPMLLGNIRNLEPGAGARRFEQGLRAARAKEQSVLERLRALPDGASKADETKRTIDRVRSLIGYREYPKYGIVRRYAIYKRALLAEAARLVAAGVLREIEDAFYLTLPELHEVVRTSRADLELVRRRRDAFPAYEALTPPRVITSEGEAVTGAYRREDVPAGALVGLAVSSGTIEGRARVVLDLADATLDAGDILVTRFTDPSWTPLFVAIRGLVTEIGGLMTHGSVIAREYGLPAVVGVIGATQRIRDGQRIRVNGTDGWVELLS